MFLWDQNHARCSSYIVNLLRDEAWTQHWTWDQLSESFVASSGSIKSLMSCKCLLHLGRFLKKICFKLQMKLLCLRIKAKQIPYETTVFVPTASKYHGEWSRKVFLSFRYIFFFNCFDARKMNDRNKKWKIWHDLHWETKQRETRKHCKLCTVWDWKCSAVHKNFSVLCKFFSVPR